MPLFNTSSFGERKSLPLLPECGACGLYKMGCHTPKMPYAGKGRRGVLIVGDFPSNIDDQAGKPFKGGEGTRLRSVLSAQGLDLDRDCWTTNAIICHPKKGRLTDKTIGHCRPNVINLIKELNPASVLLMGVTAMRAVIGHVWKSDISPYPRWLGEIIPCRELNTWLIPAWGIKDVMNAPIAVMEKEFYKQTQSVKFEAPYSIAPDVNSQVLTTHDPAEAVRWLRYQLPEGQERKMAFDYETDRLKPDSVDSLIACCSVAVSNGTISFPWTKSTAEEMSRILKDPKILKFGHNMKFEDRWTRAKLGHFVRGWLYDGMIGSHILDFNEGASGLKFQAFAKMGVGPYDGHIKPYLKSKEGGGNSPNRIREVDMESLLKYCAIDSYLEYALGIEQLKEIRS